MNELDNLRNKRGIHTPLEACILLAGESTIAKEAAAELARLQAIEAARDELLEWIKDTVGFNNAFMRSWLKRFNEQRQSAAEVKE